MYPTFFLSLPKAVEHKPVEHQSVDQESPYKKYRWNASQLDLPILGVPPDDEKVVSDFFIEIQTSNNICLLNRSLNQVLKY